MQIIYQLLIAHILADFFLQTDAMNKGKHSTGRTRWKHLVLHSMIHALTAYIIVVQWTWWYIPVVIGISHFLIDTAKCLSKKDTTGMFVLDQCAHIVVIISLTIATISAEEIKTLLCHLNILDTHFLKWMLAYGLMLKPCSIFMSKLLGKWALQGTEETSLPEAGQWIGYMERILILTFILTDHIEGVGFLLAAKSIFRFGDLNKAKDIKTTEYVMIGTMTSFSIAIITGLLVR